MRNQRRIHTSGPAKLPTHWRRAMALIAIAAAVAITVAVLHDAPDARTAAPPAATPGPPAAPLGLGSAARGSPPVRIDIKSIGASAPVDPLVLNTDGTLEVPKDYNRAGYYTGRPNPGAIGPAIIAAHVDSATGPAVFYRLRDLKPGDEVNVTRADGTEVIFSVDKVEQHPKDAFPTNAVYGPTPDATLRLITCAGPFNGAARHYRDNLIAFAHLKV